MAHHDRGAGQAGRRLVYGGHTIGLAAAQLTRALPNLATIVAWHGCDHLAPVFEGDTLASVDRAGAPRRRWRAAAGCCTFALASARGAPTPRATSTVDVLDWRLVAVLP